MPVFIPHTIAETVALISEHPEATILSGGTDVMVEVNFNHRHPTTVISLKHVAELNTWEINPATSEIFIGSGVPYAEMEKNQLHAALPALSAAARTVGSPQIRAVGTLGGNLGTCSPAGDSLPVLAALDAKIHLQSSSSTRIVSFEEFMIGPKRNSRKIDEVITGVTLPFSNGWQGYSKVGVRNAMVISVASACVAVQDNRVRIALGSVGPTIIRCTETESWLNTEFPDPSSITTSAIEEFGHRAAAEARPIDDHRSTAEYRRHAIGVLAKRLLQRSLHS